MGLNPRTIALVGSCRLITRSPRRLIRSGVRRWQRGSVSVADRGKWSCRRQLPKWSRRPRSGVAANRDRQPRSSSRRFYPKRAPESPFRLRGHAEGRSKSNRKLVARRPLVGGDSLANMPCLDAIVCGSVAVTRDGRRCGKGEGYSDLEFAILRELGAKGPASPGVAEEQDAIKIAEKPTAICQ